jgi:hypothetical protein
VWLTTRLSYEGWDPSAPGPTGPARLSLLVSRAEFNKTNSGRLFNLVHYDKKKYSIRKPFENVTIRLLAT